jgi:Serine/threonine protein kinase
MGKIYIWPFNLRLTALGRLNRNARRRNRKEKQREIRLTEVADVSLPIAEEAGSDNQPVSEPAKPVEAAVSPPEEAQPNDFPDLGDRYEVLQFVGEGGMGSVYRVRDKQLDQYFAIKLLRKHLVADKNKSSRFEQEVNSCTHLDHANLITVYSHGVSPYGAPYMVMDFIDGKNMADILGEEVFIEKNRAVGLFLQVCEGVAHAHVNGVIHLDLKPSNVLVMKTDGVEIAKVGDFGIAQMMTDDTQQITQTEEIIGSLPYMSPEHCRGETMDYRSDVYSLGCFMYEVLTGKPPFLGENPVKTIMKHVQEKPKRLRSRLTRLDIPEALEAVVLHCLEKNPSQRYQYVEELIKDLESIRDGAEPVIVRQRTLQKKAEQKPWHGWAVAGCTLTVMALYFTHMSQYDSLAQFVYCLGTLGHLVVIGPLIYLCFWMKQQFNAVSVRLLNESISRPGDSWLLWTIASGACALGIIVFTSTVQMLQFNQLLLFPEWLPGGLSWKTSFIEFPLLSIAGVCSVCFITWAWLRLSSLKTSEGK